MITFLIIYNHAIVPCYMIPHATVRVLHSSAFIIICNFILGKHPCRFICPGCLLVVIQCNMLHIDTCTCSSCLVDVLILENYSTVVSVVSFQRCISSPSFRSWKWLWWTLDSTMVICEFSPLSWPFLSLPLATTSSPSPSPLLTHRQQPMISHSSCS